MTGHSADDPVGGLDVSAWALAAFIATERDSAEHSLDDALQVDPHRTAVLRAVGLLSGDDEDTIPHASLVDASTAGAAAAARLTSLRQALDAALGRTAPGWAGQPDEVLLDQGRASAVTGRVLATQVVPTLAGLSERLRRSGAHVLDVGTGVGALALAIAQALPTVHVTGLDVLPRAVELARGELAGSGPAAARVQVREQDVARLTDVDRYDLAWVPAPFLTDDALHEALPRIVAAIVPGGWLVVGTNSAPTDPLAAAVGRWQAARNGGSTVDAERMLTVLAGLPVELQDLEARATVPGGPVLVLARRAPEFADAPGAGSDPRDALQGGARC